MSNKTILYKNKQLTIKEVASMLNVTYFNISRWYNNGMCTMDELKEMAKKYTAYAHTNDMPFDRSTTCIKREGYFIQRCVHYMHCLDYHLKHNAHPEYFKNDGACFIGEKVKRAQHRAATHIVNHNTP